MKPRDCDLVLGSKVSPPEFSAVLGGLAGVKLRLKSKVVGHRAQALVEALDYGQAGLDLIISMLSDPAWVVRQTAYLLLPWSDGAKSRELLEKNNPFQLFRSVYQYPSSSVAYSLAVSPNGTYLYSGYSDGKIVIRNIRNGKIVQTLNDHTGSVSDLVLDPEGKFLISSSWDHTIRVWNCDLDRITGIKSILEIQDLGKINSIALQSNLVAAATQSGQIGIWDLTKNMQTHTLKGHLESVWSLTFHPSHRLLVSGSSDGEVRIWDLESNQIQTWNNNLKSVHKIIFTPGGEHIICGSKDSSITIWNLATGELVTTLEAHTGSIRSLVICPDQRTLISGSADQTISIWNLSSAALMKVLEGHEAPVVSLVVSPDGSSIISSGQDGIIRVWKP